jgi:hypothetical protein
MEEDNNKDTEYQHRVDTEPHRQTGNINSRNNNINAETPSANEPDVERANDTGIGDSGLNDEKLTNKTQNHSQMRKYW